jgi:hypothetical protein
MHMRNARSEFHPFAAPARTQEAYHAVFDKPVTAVT